MTKPFMSFGTVPDLSRLLIVGVPVAVLALVLAGWVTRQRGTRPASRSGSPAVKVAALAALGCTAYSADTSWRFAADYLDMAGTTERAAMFSAAELALFATALMARQNLATQGAPGLPGTLVWVITGVQVIPAYAESGPVGGTVRAFVGPVMAAMLWHLAMGIELRLRTPGAASHGLMATLGREARERLLSRLGIAARDRDAAQITRDRATRRAVDLATRLAERSHEQRADWRGRRLTRRLSKAIGRASVGTNPAQRTELLAQLAARRHALHLATVPLPSPWSPQHSLATTTVRARSATTTMVPIDGLPTVTDLVGDRGPVPGNARGEAAIPETAARDAGARDREAGGERRKSASGAALGSNGGTCPPESKSPAQGPTGDRGPCSTESGTDPTGDREPTDTDTGTDPTGDREPTDTDTGTDPTGDREPTDTDTGTDPTGDRMHTARRRQLSTAAKSKDDHRRPSRSLRTQRPSQELQESIDQLVEQVRPHVPALLERDGNEAVTRVQLREILRREGLKGGRNDRLSLVLQRLRSSDSTTTTGSPVR
ncbi:hypothetical protein SUDANB105_00684 [Streptomyces sp. enrichment culture]|uniref:hypothetical protein n=1 Tax=Streptomyces sp. enrichment culture TaxID=1795815 RepID=UPI003F552BF1